MLEEPVRISGLVFFGPPQQQLIQVTKELNFMRRSFAVFVLLYVVGLWASVHPEAEYGKADLVILFCLYPILLAYQWTTRKKLKQYQTLLKKRLDIV